MMKPLHIGLFLFVLFKNNSRVSVNATILFNVGVYLL